MAFFCSYVTFMETGSKIENDYFIDCALKVEKVSLLNVYFSKEDMKVTKNHMKKYPMSLVIRKIQMKHWDFCLHSPR